MADGSSCDTPLHIAAGCGDVEEVKRLLNSKQYEVDERNSEQQTPLHSACANGQVGVVEILVREYSASTEVVDGCNYTPLLLGAKNHKIHIVVVLLMMAKTRACVIEKCHVHILESLVTRFYHDSETQEDALRLLINTFDLGPSYGSDSNVNLRPVFIILLLVAVFGLWNLSDVFEKTRKI